MAATLEATVAEIRDIQNTARASGQAERAAHLKEKMKNENILHLAYAHDHGTDREEITNWVWPL